ncbi:MAG TPA: hypothetical protein VF550_13245, partial [Polyangia bacterium]
GWGRWFNRGPLGGDRAVALAGLFLQGLRVYPVLQDGHRRLHRGWACNHRGGSKQDGRGKHEDMVSSHYPLAPCEEPTGMALDAKLERLFVGCGNKMMAVVSATTGKVVATLDIGPGVDGTEFDATTGDVFNACGKDGTLSVIHQDTADKYHVVQNLSTQLGARTLAVGTSSHRVFLAAAQFGDKPAPSEANPKPRAPILPGTFVVLVVGK